MAFRWEAIELERAARQGNHGAAELRLAGHAPPPEGGCPSVDDILDFCSGRGEPEQAGILRQHLDVCAACMDLVTGALNDWSPPEPADWFDVACNFRRGDRIDDRYEIVRFLARGGMGEVYEAIDTKTSERVALKAVLASACDDPAMLRCFRRESRLACRVRHPNVCRVNAPPRASDAPVAFFTMEFIEGRTLSDLLLGGPLPTRQALEIARQLLLGLRAIHRAGVLHLDIKSSNTMLRHGRSSEAVIVDFGLARSARRASPEHGVRPITGSLAYMPPEQILGQSPDFRNDVFAFGVVLFQMLTGRLPFPAAEPSATSSLVRRLSAEAPRPSQVLAGIPERLDEVVLTCLATRDLRYRDVGSVLDALETH